MIQLITDTIEEMHKIYDKIGLRHFCLLLNYCVKYSGVQPVADFLGVHYNTLQNWRLGKCSPSLTEVVRVLSKLGYDVYVTYKEN